MAEIGGNSSGENRTDERVAAGPSVTRIIKIVALFLLLLIVVLLGLALATALTAAERWAPLFQIFRDVFVLILVLESILVVAALIVFLLQAAGFFIMLRAEVKPIFENARETTRLSRATAGFVNANAIDPLIQIKSFVAGMLAFLRELIRIRQLMHSDRPRSEATDEPQTP